MSGFQRLKPQMLSMQPLLADRKDAAHIYLGVLCFVLAVLFFRRRGISYAMLLPGLVVSLLLEAFDLRDDHAGLGRLRWGASLRDVVNTNLVPLVMLVLFKPGTLFSAVAGCPRRRDDEATGGQGGARG